MTDQVLIEQNLCQTVTIYSINDNKLIDGYGIKNNNIVFYDIPAGTYEIKIQLKGYSLYSGTITLKDDGASEDGWYEKIYIGQDVEYRDVEIILHDGEGNNLNEQMCDLMIVGTNYIVENLVSNLEGKLPYIFRMPINLEVQINLYYEEETYKFQYNTSDISSPLYAQFETPKQEKITVSESHEPNDIVTNVYMYEWGEEDRGIDGNSYGAGWKIVISDLYMELGANSQKIVISRMIIPLDKKQENTTFEGVFVLDQTMYGSKSTGTIKILLNNEEVFSTGEISGNTLEAFPFYIECENADTIIVVTETNLNGSNFAYGFVNKE